MQPVYIMVNHCPLNLDIQSRQNLNEYNGKKTLIEDTTVFTFQLCTF